MRTITSLIVSCLIIAAGCASPGGPVSTYDISDQRLHAWDEWRQTLVADAVAALQPYVDSANRDLSQFEGVIYVDVKEYERVVYFQPVQGAEWQEREFDYFTFPGPVIKDIPERVKASPIWTDRFALAHEFTGRCEISEAKLSKIDLDSSEPFEVTVLLEVSTVQRNVIASDTKPIPHPPAGYTYWRTDPREAIGLGGVNRLAFPRLSPRLPGAIHSEESQHDDLANEAAQLLAEKKYYNATRKATVVLSYSIEDAQWRPVVRPETEPPDFYIRQLRGWRQGLRQIDRGKVHVPR